jgi:hypothetical protein
MRTSGDGSLFGFEGVAGARFGDCLGTLAAAVAVFVVDGFWWRRAMVVGDGAVAADG